MAVEYSISKYSDVTKTRVFTSTPEITRKILEKYFGSAFRELGTVFIVITIRTKFPDIENDLFICAANGQHGVKPHAESI